MESSVKTEKLKTNVVDAPSLFVGIGGTGSKIVTRVAELCAPEEKENISFVCMDTNVNDLNKVANSKANIVWIQTSNTQTVGSYLDYDNDARKNWFPKSAVMYDKTVSEGAGQVRAISRLALNSIIKTGKISPLFKAIDDLFRKTGKELKQAMRCVIATTASGGTGSGMLLPLAMLIRNYVKEKYPNISLIVRTLILLPETLDSVIKSQTERDSQARNAYATIKELNAFMMKGSGFIDLDDDLKQFTNLKVDVPVAGTENLKSLSLLPTDFCFLMDGQDAEDSTMTSKEQYVEQAAQSLYEQNIGPMQSQAFSVEDNIIKEMTKPGNYGRNRFGGIGSGIIRYPYEKIADYVAYDLAIDSIGSSGEASKWTKYDHEFKQYEFEQKKLGISYTEMDKLYEYYNSALDRSTDNFSKDVKNFCLDNLDARVNKYFNALDEYIINLVKTNKAISESYENADAIKYGQDYNNKDNKPQDDIAVMQSFKESVFARGKDGAYLVETIAKRTVEGIMTNEQKTVANESPFSIENLITDPRNGVAHPCAVRYILYKVRKELEERIKDLSGSISNLEVAIDDYDTKEYNGLRFAKNDPVVGLSGLAEEITDEPTLSQKLKGYKRINSLVNDELPSYFVSVNQFCEETSRHAAYVKVLGYIKAYAEEFENFFGSFAEKVKGLSRGQLELSDELQYQKGDAVINVCVEPEILRELSAFSLQKTQSETTMLNSDINGAIFDAIKQNALFNMELKNTGEAFIDEDKRVDVFDDILFGYFRSSVREKCDDIDKDIIGAIELEKRLKERIRLHAESNGEEQVFEQVSIEDAKKYILTIIQRGVNIAAPSIQRVVNEEPREINACAYNKALLDNRRIRIKDLLPSGEAVDTISKYEIHFYNALYNLTPDKIKKFAAPYDTETGHKESGTYHRAYTDYAKLIGPDSTKNAAISTHIDKRWDSIKSMPELDFAYQEDVVKKIHKAFIYGIIHKAIVRRPLSEVANGKEVFLYCNSSNRDVELVVPNGTLCDEFYEILDSLYVNAKVVEDIGLIKNRKRAMSAAKNCNYEDTEFFRDMASFNIFDLVDSSLGIDLDNHYDGTQKTLDEIKKEIAENVRGRNFDVDDTHSTQDISDDGKKYLENPTSIFTIPLMYYCSLPKSGRFVSEISSMVNATIDVLREELTQWYAEKDVKFVLCTRLTDELNLLKRNYRYFEEHFNASKSSDNPVIDIIQRAIRDVILSTPEPEDYEVLLDIVAKEFKQE